MPTLPGRDRPTPSPHTDARASASPLPGRDLVAAALGIVVAAGVVLRFTTTSAVWLDEALSVAIADLPLARLPDALRMDGHPPLYYVLLHGWVRLFGSGDVAVRALSGLCSAAALPITWVAGRRVAGRPGAVAATALLASSPFAIRYATEARMYAVIVLLVLMTGLALDAALRAPTPLRLAGVALGTAALLLTHYWGAYLVAAVGAGLGVAALRGSRPARTALLAAAGGGLLALPWLPVLAFQLAHTGTPWAPETTPRRVLATVSAFGGGRSLTGVPVSVGLAVLAVLSVLPWTSRALAPPHPTVLRLAAGGAATAVLAAGVSLGTGAAWVPRYASVLLPLYLVCAAAGWARLRSTAGRRVILVVLCGFGLASGAEEVHDPRTNAAAVVDVLRDRAGPDDLVVYCPDQVGPAVNRLFGDDVDQVVYPTGGPPDRVNWTDYLERHQRADPLAFAGEVAARVAGRELFLVWADGYPGLGDSCGQLRSHLAARSAQHDDLPLRSTEGLERSAVERFELAPAVPVVTADTATSR